MITDNQPHVYRDFSGKTHVLRPYWRGCAAREVGHQWGYSLWIKSIFPYKYPRRISKGAPPRQLLV